MEIKREGITFDCYFKPGTRDTHYVQGDPAELVLEGHTITDRAAMVAEYGDKGVADIFDMLYYDMLEEAEEAYYDDFDAPDDFDESDTEVYEGE